MKAYFLVLLVAACGALTRAQRCLTNDDCSKRQCCVKTAPPFIGRCTMRGGLGAPCLRDEDVDEKHQPRCPCQAGLVCRPTSTLHTEVGDIPQNLRCVLNVTMLAPALKIGAASELTNGDVFQPRSSRR